MSVTFTPANFNWDAYQTWADNDDAPPQKFPILNLSNTNAAAVVQVIGMPMSANPGMLPVDEVAKYRRAIFEAMNTDKSKAFERPFEQTLGALGCHVIDCGISQEGIIERLERLDFVLQACQEGNCDLVWS